MHYKSKASKWQTTGISSLSSQNKLIENSELHNQGARNVSYLLPTVCVLSNGEEVARVLNLYLHVIILQLHEVAPHIHLLPKGTDQLFPELIHLLPLKVIPTEVYFSYTKGGEKKCNWYGKSSQSAEREKEATE